MINNIDKKKLKKITDASQCIIKKWIIEYFLYIYDGGCRLCYLERVTVEHCVGNVFGEVMLSGKSDRGALCG